MERKSEQKRQQGDALFSWWMLYLCIAGLLLNLILSKSVLALNLPLYLDNAGSILVAVLGGPLPGMTVGFLSNVLSAVSNPISMYYGILTIIIAWLAAVYSQKGMLKNWKGWLMAAGSFVLVGGGAGSVMTWLLYGRTISGIAEPYAKVLASVGISPFFAQLATDMIIDVPDKLLTVGIVWLILRFYPEKLSGKFPYSDRYDHSDCSLPTGGKEKQPYRHSVQRRLTGIVILAVVVVGIFSLSIETYYHQEQMQEDSRYISRMVSAQAALCVDGDLADQQLLEGRSATGYLETEEKLYGVLEKAPESIRYIYVYKVQEDGCYVIYDLDVPGVKAQQVGIRVENDNDIYNRIDEFLTGGDVAPGYQNNIYGTYISAYTPVYNSAGATVAYACADIDLSSYTNDMLIYIIQNASLVFAVILLASYITIWYVNYHVTKPLHQIVNHTKALDQISPENWLDSTEWKERSPINTGDELEELYTAVTDTEKNVCINVQKRMEAEQELLQTKALEEANEKLQAMIKKADEASRAKTEFFSRMSHDMRTPMNGILGMVELSEGETDQTVLMKNMEKIKYSGEYLLGLINDTLDFQKIESGKLKLEPEITDSRELFLGIVDMITKTAEVKGVTFHTVVKGITGQGYIRVDALRMRQIFVNLLSNAVKFTPAGGTVELGFEAFGHDHNIYHERITITDTGCGMSQEFLKQGIFQPFSQEHNETTTKYAGSGLGLSIAKSLVELMGGTITVESEQGAGTRFTLLLDFERVDDSEYKKAANHDDSRKMAAMELLHGKHFLLAEDHPLNAEIAMKLLEKAFCTSNWVHNGQECIDLFQKQGAGYYDAILMDVRMPVMDGMETARTIRQLKQSDAKDIPIIAMTANAYMEDIAKCREAGMSAHVAKPISPIIMYETIAAVLQK